MKDRNRLYWEDFKQMPTPCPPLEEQVLIADGIAHSTRIADDWTRGIQRQISLIHEYRHRLIADVVTGKVDMREASAALPEVDPLESEDDLDDTLDIGAEAEGSELALSAEEVEA